LVSPRGFRPLTGSTMFPSGSLSGLWPPSSRWVVYKVASSLPSVGPLLSELEDFKVKVTKKGHDGYGAATGHDDIVLAVALAVWWSAIGGRYTNRRPGGLH
jgi:hypothetical protein